MTTRGQHSLTQRLSLMLSCLYKAQKFGLTRARASECTQRRRQDLEHRRKVREVRAQQQPGLRLHDACPAVTGVRSAKHADRKWGREIEPDVSGFEKRTSLASGVLDGDATYAVR
jgi:hypothetical protein